MNIKQYEGLKYLLRSLSKEENCLQEIIQTYIIFFKLTSEYIF